VIYLRIRVEKMLFMAENILEPAARGVLFVDGTLPTQWSHYPLLYPLTAALYPVLGHLQFLVSLYLSMKNISL